MWNNFYISSEVYKRHWSNTFALPYSSDPKFIERTDKLPGMQAVSVVIIN